MSKTEQRLQEKIKRVRQQIRKLKAEKRRQDKENALLADARLGALLRLEHPALAGLLEAQQPTAPVTQ